MSWSMRVKPHKKNGGGDNVTSGIPKKDLEKMLGLMCPKFYIIEKCAECIHRFEQKPKNKDPDEWAEVKL